MEESLVSSQLNKFALNFYKILKNKNEDNIIISPFSISTALCATLGGAKEKTAHEMKSALQLDEIEDAKIHAAFSSFLKVFKESKYVTLRVANKAVVEKKYDVDPEFVEHLAKWYDSSIDTVDFQGNLIQEVNDINKWVQKVTKDKIKDALSPNAITPYTIFILINAVYFKGLWKDPFEEMYTRKGRFMTVKNKVKEVDMMHQREFYHLFPCKPLKCEVLEIPYKDDNYSMLIFLPNEQDGIKFVEDNITVEHLTTAMKRRKFSYVELTLPKFKLETSAALKEILEKMGMKDAFSKTADFSGISDEEVLFIESVFHSAVIEVNETGTEAAAVTIVQCGGGCPQVNIFNVDHPFLYALVNKKFNNVLFMGRVMKP